MSKGDRYEKDGVVRLMAEAGGYIMARRRGCVPFVMSRAQWMRLGATAAEGAAVELWCGSVRKARTTTHCPNCGRRHADLVIYASKATELCPVRACEEDVGYGCRPVHAARELKKAEANCASVAAKRTP